MVAAPLATGSLTLHAWVYEIESGRILAYDPSLSRFAPISVEGVNQVLAGLGRRVASHASA